MTSNRLLSTPTLGASPTNSAAARGRIGLVVAGSTLAGLLLAGISTLLVAGGSSEPVVTGLALLSFAAGWGMMRALSARRTTQPQNWATVPAVVLGVSGIAYLLLRPSDAVLTAVAWSGHPSSP